MVDMKRFKKVAIYSSLRDKKVSLISYQLEEVLENLGIKVLLSKSSIYSITSKKKIYSDAYIEKNADLVVCIGGDGTLLGSARKFGSKGLPVLGINLGKVGFLTDIAPEELTQSIKQIVAGKYTIDSRFFLKASLGTSKKQYIALNEAVIHSGQVAQMIEYELYIDNKSVYRQKADGIIVSTPTGSTAYSLSGNASIVHPNVEAITLIPMFPHSLTARPLLVAKTSNIKIKVLSAKGATLSMDSHNFLNLKKDNEINLSQSDSDLKLIHPLEHDFYAACRNKLGWSLGISD